MNRYGGSTKVGKVEKVSSVYGLLVTTSPGNFSDCFTAVAGRTSEVSIWEITCTYFSMQSLVNLFFCCERAKNAKYIGQAFAPISL